MRLLATQGPPSASHSIADSRPTAPAACIPIARAATGSSGRQRAPLMSPVCGHSLRQTAPLLLPVRQARADHVCRAQQSSTSSAVAEAPPAIGNVEAQPVFDEAGQPTAFPATPGVYAVYAPDGSLQYIGLSRKVALSVGNHAADLPELTHAVKFAAVADSSREGLTDAWKQWIQAAVEETGAVPPGNVRGETRWTRRARAAKPEIKLTPGKGAADLSVPLERILDAVVKDNRVVAFIKGTRTAPQCGFSHKVLTLLNESRADYEVVNVLDDLHNPGLRETIKSYSQWPTIPQLYIDGEFVGGADIVEEMATKGELAELLAAKR